MSYVRCECRRYPATLMCRRCKTDYIRTLTTDSRPSWSERIARWLGLAP